ncbi:MAG: hypothetical protein GWO86_00300 [Planctomycetes bacterium]|nr:hypothetical protein [Planctomycetota bacterium]
MPVMSAAIEYGNYISIIKFVVFIVLFFAWLPLLLWVNRDAKFVRTEALRWTMMMFVAGAAAAVVWLLTPLFIIGILLYLITVSAAALAYVMHRNARVDEYQKVLTAEHIKSLFVNEEKKIKAISKGLGFITANNNEVPAPMPKTPEFIGYKMAQELFDDILWRRASDVIFTPSARGYDIYYRIDGTNVKQQGYEREDIEYFVRYIKHLADLNINERRKPQKGFFNVRKDTEKIQWELTTSGTTAGEQIRLRLVKQYSLMKIEDVGLFGEQIEQIKQLRDRKAGLFIVSGPRQSGVTSTFYALIRNHDPFMNNINTLEKNPAAELANVTQNVFKLSDTGTSTYAKRFQSMLRTGPDIVGIADCQDSKTASLACAAAKDSKMVYVTLEAQSALAALGTWIKLVGDKNLVADTLAGISCQRLVRILCLQCREPYEPNRDLLKKFNMPANKIKLFYRQGQVQYDKHGKPILCEKCQGTGFYGRTGVFETIIISDQIRDIIRQSKTLADIGGQFRRARMLYLQEQALRKVADGITSVNEVIKKFSSQENKQKRKSQPKIDNKK